MNGLELVAMGFGYVFVGAVMIRQHIQARAEQRDK